LDWYSKLQGATSHSTTEAEMVSASKMLREVLVPQIALWSLLLQRPIHSFIEKDNNSTIIAIGRGYSPQLRYLERHHRVSVGLVHEMCSAPDITVEKVESNEQRGDLFTKPLDKNKLQYAFKLVGLV
jgi:hypothetical protein